jgi:Family of unknown function (DUF6090)
MEHEVQTHVKKVYKAWKDPRKSFWDKAKEIMLEIAIIVFAVSLSIWLHNWSEHRHEQKEVKAFLIGLKTDLDADSVEIKSDIESFENSGKAFSYLTTLKKGQLAEKDSLNKYLNALFSSATLLANKGRFEGFKSSGKLGHIEDEILQNDILDLYEENIPQVVANTDYYNKIKYDFLQVSNENLKRITDTSTNFKTFVSSDIGFAHARMLAYTSNVVQLYKAVLAKHKKIITAINKQYDLK